MLESLRDVPATMAAEISPLFHFLSLVSNLAVTALSAVLCYAAHEALVVRLQYTLPQIALGGSGGVLAITAALYVYYVYIVDSGSSTSTPTPTGESSIKINMLQCAPAR